MSTEIVTPGFDTAALKPRILHLGFGAFARAHPMVYLSEGLAKAGGDWGVVVARLNSGRAEIDALDAAGHRYHVAEADGEGATLREIGVVTGTLHPARDGIGAIPDLIATEAMSVILLTVTEKGYCARSGGLDRGHAGIIADLAAPQTPGTAIGVIAEGLARRRAAGLGGLTVLSCDNQPENGHLTRAVILDFAEARDPALAAWIAETCTFPCSMVDRIVPAMTGDSHALLESLLGRPDPNGIVCEPFRQWVIEDSFAAGRPPFAEGGAELVADVRPFEEMKLRMLNGSHTMLACRGQLAGHVTVDGCMGDAALRAKARRLMLEEQAPTLSVPQSVDLDAYAEALLTRFANPRLRHRLDQIASDSSQKMPQRLFAPALVHLETGGDWPVTAESIAAWIRLLAEGRGSADPRKEELDAAVRDTDPVAAVLALPELVPAGLAGHPGFLPGIRTAFAALPDTVAAG
ncbi:mannitol dehydrogenase family protein [Mangrovicoccus ximenensis]|uniref:mannitol dehydrogenase family protein n=1 Tax=Mangrovicoccus ximenensis TaxID=1911570 RepID=UPI001F4416CC|nr:mannitol dehydrogenase family protein [Mangrovicoccus ximenensis]